MLRAVPGTDAILNLDDRQGKLKGWANRIGRLGTGVVYGMIAVIGAKLAIAGGNAGSGQAGAHASSTAIHGGGGVLVTIVGVGFLIGAVDQLVKAITASFKRQLRPAAPGITVMLGRIGFAGHAAIIAVLAYLIIRSGLTERSQPLGVGPAIEDLRRMGVIYQAVAVSLIIFGIFSLLQAWYRCIDDRTVLDVLHRNSPN